ncbi:tyrosine-protein kinase RYK-like isoform X2 [Daphnia pulex]|uniref:tyrosine-protein kinase RYK-like isoform X2 n=1 Tax=Daphnia pulex TaxID=6669 RepID=UPI001EDF3F7E|nr:tyrosine-protein kinase RYK-like isoform X2 [Daphnia pulex]
MGYNLIVFFFLLFFSLANAGLNFYISQQESFRVLGLVAELAYVRDGSINDVAQHFVVPVPSHIQELCFVWVNADSKAVKYSIFTKDNSMQPVNHVSLNISNQGVVPREPQIFCLLLPCSTYLPSKLEVSMKINFTSFNNVTVLNVVMKKDCSSDFRNIDQDVLSKVIPAEDSSFMLFVAVGIAFGVLVVSLAAASCFLCPKHNLCRQQPQTQRTIAPNNGTAVYSPVQASCTEEAGVATLYVNDPAAHQIVAEDKPSFRLQRNNIIIGKTLLEGTFGSIFHATLQIPGIPLQDVIVKTVKNNAAETQVRLMMEEGTRFQDLKHQNIYPLIGIVDGDGCRPLLVYPSVTYGNLKRWLLYCRGSLDGSLPHPLCTQDLVTIALHVLRGVQYLHQQNIIHKDLATRNCVIDDLFHVKLTDMALSRDFFPNDYHCLGDNENRPIKWMAMESLTRRDFSTASDIWSFGVVLWEVTTLAQQPYVEIDPFEVGRVLRDGYRLTQPVNCPDELYAIMAYCWSSSKSDRPTAPQLYRELHQFHQTLNEYI